MNIEEARQLVADTVAGRKKWGKHFEVGSTENVLDALIVLSEHGEDGAEVTKAHRETGAAKARETKAKQRLEEQKELNQPLHQEIEALTEALKDARVLIRSQRAQVAAVVDPLVS